MRGWLERLRRIGLLPFLLGAMLIALAVQVVRRVSFPWDLILWSESPFLTDLIKLHHGEPLHGPPSDASSFVYAPGLSWLAFGLLRPLGAHLDIRAGRVVVVALGIGAALLFARSMLVLARADGARPSTRVVFACHAIAVLAVFKSTTADVAHPDNLHLFHLALVTWLGLLATRRSDARLALVAATVAGLGALAKQTAALTAVGLCLGLIACGRFRFRALLPAVAAGALVTGAATALLLVPPSARFWTYELLRHHPVQPKFEQLFVDVFFTPHRLLLWIAAAWALARLWPLRADRRAALGLLGGVALGAVFPSLAGFFKAWGANNNLTTLDLWSLLVAAPLLAPALAARRRSTGALALLLSVTLLPIRYGPTSSIRRHVLELDALIAEDVAAGRRVLVAHGAAFLLRAGDRSIPRDRANSVLELSVGGRAQLAETSRRLRDRAYDVIYLNSPWYDAETLRALHESYARERRIEPAGHVPAFANGWQFLHDTTWRLVPMDSSGSLDRVRGERAW